MSTLPHTQYIPSADRVCEVCGTWLVRRYTEQEDTFRRRRYCCRPCMYIGRRRKHAEDKKTCKHCGKVFGPRGELSDSQQEGAKGCVVGSEGPLMWGKRKYCSLKCSKAARHTYTEGEIPKIFARASHNPANQALMGNWGIVQEE